MKSTGEWTELGQSILSETSRTQKGKHYSFLPFPGIGFGSSDTCCCIWNSHRGQKINKGTWGSFKEGERKQRHKGERGVKQPEGGDGRAEGGNTGGGQEDYGHF